MRVYIYESHMGSMYVSDDEYDLDSLYCETYGRRAEMNQEELNEIIAKHNKWLNGEVGGVRANLSGCDLSGCDLSGCDLSGCDLRGCDIRGCDLRGCDLSGCDLRDSDLKGCDLRYSDLKGCDIRGCDLRDNNLDCSVFPLWCGGLDVHIDDRIATQLLYHLVCNVQYSKNTSKELKNLLGSTEIITKANEFHRVDECGEIEIKDGEQK